MAAGFVQMVTNHNNGSNSLATTIAATGAGNCIVICAGGYNLASIDSITVGSDSATQQVLDAWLVDRQQIWVLENCTGGSTTVTINTTNGGGGTSQINAVVLEFSGVVTSAATDQTASANGNSSAPSSGATAPLAQSAEVVVGAVTARFSLAFTLTGPGSPWTNSSGINNSSGANFTRTLAGYKIVSSTAAATYAVTSDNSGCTWAACVLTLLASTSVAKSSSDTGGASESSLVSVPKSSADASAAGAEGQALTHATQTSAETASAVDSGTPTLATLSSADTGSATAEGGSAGQPVASSDGGRFLDGKSSGTDGDAVASAEASSIKATFSSSDASSAAAETGLATLGAHGIDTSSAAAETSSIQAALSDGDSGSSAADAGTAVPQGTPANIFDGDTSTAQEVDLVTDADTGLAAEAVVLLAVLAVETGSGADASLPFGISGAGDVFLFAELGSGTTSNLSSSDTGSGAEVANQPALPLASADTGHGTDAAVSALPDIFDDQPGIFTDASTIQAALSDSDSGSAAEVGGPRRPIASADTCLGTDGVLAVRVSGADTGTGTEAFSFLVRVDPGETGTFAENQSFPNLKYDGDTGNGTESSLVVAQVHDGDFFHWNELSWRVIPASLLFGTMEGFTIYRAGVLIGGKLDPSGTEDVQLYGVTSATITPQVTTIHNVADDLVLGEWNYLTTCQVQVVGGFIPLNAHQVLFGAGLATGTDGATFGVPLGIKSMAVQFPLSLVLRCRGRDYLGLARTYDIIIYHVIMGFVDITAEYKSGVSCDYQANAHYSLTDEAGNQLSQPSIGRVVESPGVLGGQITSVFGQSL